MLVITNIITVQRVLRSIHWPFTSHSLWPFTSLFELVIVSFITERGFFFVTSQSDAVRQTDRHACT